MDPKNDPASTWLPTEEREVEAGIDRLDQVK
jgi:hypothetical protein